VLGDVRGGFFCREPNQLFGPHRALRDRVQRHNFLRSRFCRSLHLGLDVSQILRVECGHTAPRAEAEVSGRDVLASDYAHRNRVLGGGALEGGGGDELAADRARTEGHGVLVFAAAGFLWLADLTHARNKRVRISRT